MNFIEEQIAKQLLDYQDSIESAHIEKIILEVIKATLENIIEYAKNENYCDSPTKDGLCPDAKDVGNCYQCGVLRLLKQAKESEVE